MAKEGHSTLCLMRPQPKSRRLATLFLAVSVLSLPAPALTGSRDIVLADNGVLKAILRIDDTADAANSHWMEILVDNPGDRGAITDGHLEFLNATISTVDPAAIDSRNAPTIRGSSSSGMNGGSMMPKSLKPVYENTAAMAQRP